MSSQQLNEGERWYVAYTQPHRESLAEINVAEQNFRTYLPRRPKTVSHARKLRTTIAPIFPRYLFIGFHLERDRWRSLNGTPGILRLLMANERPLAVPHGVVEALMALTEGHGSDLRPGKQVRLVAGPFANALGMIESLNDAGRVRVLLQIMNSAVRVNLSQDWCESVL